MLSCYCDGDEPSVTWTSMPVAAKEHACSECLSPIMVGAKYERVRGIWETQAMTYKTCLACQRIREMVYAHIPCFCWYYTTMIEDALMYVSEYEDDLPELMVIVKDGLELRRTHQTNANRGGLC